MPDPKADPMTSTGPATPQRRRPLRSTVAAILALTALTSASLTGISLASGPSTAEAAAGNPGTPSAGTVVYAEDFQNVPGTTPIQRITDYTGDAGQKYTADQAWLQYCNGWVAAEAQDPNAAAQISDCNGANGDQSGHIAWNNVQQQAFALGRFVGETTAQAQQNYAVSALTQAAPGAGKVEFQTATNVPFRASNRFVNFSVDVAASNCAIAAHPLLQFQLLNSAGTATDVGSEIDGCNTAQTVDVPAFGTSTARSVNVGTYASNGALLFTGTSVGVRMINNQGTGNGNDHTFDNIKILDVTPQLDKVFSPARVETGGTSTLTFTVTNTSELAAKNGWSFTDTLPNGLTLASSTVGGTCNATSAVTAGGNSVAVTNGQLAAGTASCTITVQVTSATAGSYTNNADNVTEVGLNPPGSTTVTFTDPSYTVSKSVNKTTANPGAPVTYSVQVKNTGEWAYDDNAPAGLQRASFTDDLSDVLDDATYNGDASDGATISGNTLSWSGTLAVGQTRTITYSVTPKNPASASDTGNLELNNEVTPTGSGGTCVTGECTTSTPVQALQITKTADQTDVVPGSTINYTVTVKNTGKVDYTTGSDAASFSDDLSKVLDDANWNNDATASAGTVSYDQPTLSWSGPIAAGDTVTVKYSVTVKDPDTGDSQIDNAVTSTTPGNNCVAGNSDPNCQVAIPSASYTVQKTASSATVNPGDTVTYTVTVTNTGARAYTADDPASFRDDLSKVLDDATYNDDATQGATVDGSTLTWSGALAVDGTVTVTYSVTVKDPDTGDKTITNAVAPAGPGGRCVTAADCTTTTGVRSYTTAKTSSKQTVREGDTVTYTVTVTNTGTAAYTDQVPATFTDDLSAVLDDATYNGDATQGATVTGNTLSWSGELAVGQSIQVRYSVTVNTPDTGDKVLTNAVTPTGPGGSCTTAAACATTTPVQSYTVSKKASSATTTPGAKVTYTVTVTNTGGAAYTSDAPASFTDDLSKVVDDATYNGDAVSDSDGSDPGVVSFTSPKLTWTGPLSKGATTTVTYTVTVGNPDTGDKVLTNAVDPTGPGGTCTTAGDCTTTTPVQSIAFTKVADTTKVIPGDDVTYTITVKNTGQVPYTDGDPATFTDDLTQVLDDATYNNNAAATAGTTDYRAPTLAWSGPVDVGQTVTVTYSVTVKNPDTGDKVLDNAVVSNSPGSGCQTDSSDPDCRSVIPAGSYTVSKTASSSSATQGSTITYTVTVTNTGKTAYTTARPASFQDNLIQVLDDATYNGDAKATTGTTAYQRPNLTWSGPLPVGGVVTVTYSATVNTPDTGDRKVINAVIPTGPGGACATAGSCQTTTDVPPGFAVHTGGTATAAVFPSAGWFGLLGVGIAATIGCAAIWFRRRVL